ncbi:unnamed protein product [Mucor hiemalis]
MFEILLNVYQSVTKADLREYALVSKVWLDAAQSALYTKVQVNNFSQLQKFCDTVQRNPVLGKKVKVFFAEEPSKFGLNNNEEVVRLLSHLFYFGLPNLQEVDAGAANTYTPILNALHNSRLNQLKKINSHSYTMKEDEKTNYASCIFLMRDRVENVILGNMPASMPDFLYSNLNQLKAVKVLDVRTCHSSWFQTLEHVTASCKDLKQLNYHFQGHSNQVSFDVNAISPSDTKLLIIHSDQENMLLYIMHKFPQPKELNYYGSDHYLSSEKPEELTRILDYLAPIEAFDVSSFVVDDKIVDFISSHWNSTSAAVASRAIDTGFTIMYHPREYDSQHTEIINKLDNYIGEFRLRYDAEDKQDLPSEFLDHLFTRCPQLNNLHLHGWMLRQRRYIPDYELSISQLYLGECSIYGDYLSRLSAVVPHLERLILEENSYFHSCRRTSRYNDEHIFGERNTLEIDMPHTEIDLVEFFMPDGDRESISYVKVLVESENTSYYYGYKDDCFITNANAMDYSTTCESQRTFISCRNKPEIRFNYR